MRQLLLIAALAAFTSACQSPWHGTRFVPAQAKLYLAAQSEPAAKGEARVALRGIHLEEGDRPTSIDVRMFLVNRSEALLSIDPASLRLVTGDKQTLTAAHIRSFPAKPLGLKERAVFEISFPLPPGFDLRGEGLRDLDLYWTLRYGSESVPCRLKFVGVPVDDLLFGYDPDDENIDWPIEISNDEWVPIEVLEAPKLEIP